MGRKLFHTLPGSWHIKLLSGTLWVRPIHLFATWSERASVLRILLLAVREAREAGSPIPDLDLVYAAGDQDPTIMFNGCRRSSRHAPCDKMPVLVHARSSSVGSSAIPFPEFTWVGARHSPPWCQLAHQITAAAKAQPWASRNPRAFFTGACATGKSRQALLELG